MKKIFLIITIAIAFLTSCQKSFELTPPDKLSPSNAFKTEKDLQLYANSFYNDLPQGNDIVRGDQTSDFLAGSTIDAYLSGSYSAEQAGGWSWTSLRNINYFLEQMKNAEIPDDAGNHFQGLARFFRANFYFNKVKQFGKVPWQATTLTIDDPDLYKTQDPREYVMDRVLEDLNFACENIREPIDPTSSNITRLVALAYKARICLFEGTYRKYHEELSLQTSANQWFLAAADAAKKVIDAQQYRLNIESDPAMSFRNLFINEQPKSNEIMLAAVNNLSLRVLNDANWYWTSATYGRRLSFTKNFINTFLNIDGTRFTDQNNYNNVPFWEEVENRDLRLQQTIRMGDYKREGQAAPPDFTYTYTGYMPYKFTLDSKATDGRAENSNSLPLMRYAEVLLNYAEAMAELGSFTTAEWNITVKPLRERAGLTNTEMPTVADEYLRQEYFNNISDPQLLEIRRERGIELALEGFRYDDLMRWKLGSLLLKPYMGLYVPAMNTPYDLNQDGKDDVSFVTAVPSNPQKGIVYFVVNGTQHYLTEQNSGNIIAQNNLKRVFDESFMYLRPIPIKEITLNPNLKQNDKWESK